MKGYICNYILALDSNFFCLSSDVLEKIKVNKRWWYKSRLCKWWLLPLMCGHWAPTWLQMPLAPAAAVARGLELPLPSLASAASPSQRVQGKAAWQFPVPGELAAWSTHTAWSCRWVGVLHCAMQWSRGSIHPTAYMVQWGKVLCICVVYNLGGSWCSLCCCTLQVMWPSTTEKFGESWCKSQNLAHRIVCSSHQAHT